MRRAVALTAGLVCVAAIAGAAVDLNAAVSAHFVREELQRKQLALARGETWRIEIAGAVPLGANAPALATAAVNRAVDVQMQATQPRSALEEAIGLAQAALQLRPDWGEGLVARAYLTQLRDGEQSPAVRADVERSYLRAPYLKDAAEWRVQFALRNWAMLSPVTRTHAVDELVWYVRLRPAMRDAFFEMARASPAYQPVMLRWRTVRALDSDLRDDGS